MTRIKLYTDGACSGNPGRGGWGAVVVNESGDNIMQTNGGYRHITNNRMEILAVIEGLDRLLNEINVSRDTDIKVTVCSDSQLVVKTMTEGWGKKSNHDLWTRLDHVLEEYDKKGVKVDFVKVKGHSSDKFNNLVDKIAVEASLPQNAILRDENYEGIVLFYEPKPEKREPEISNILLSGMNTPKSRKVEVYLTNGSCVTILPCHGGFQQGGGTQEEFRLTLDIAWKYQSWLNGGKL